MSRFKYVACALALIGFAALAKPIGNYPSIHLSELPDSLRSVWKELKPEMNEMSHCAAAFDSHSDGEKMAFRCSIHIKMSAEGERRAMRYCEEKRAEKGIKMPCKLVEE
ncbi:hypothetical protein [Limnohabitans sp. INBF002]|jgi:hypothetical protein|uniref:hypothetical protein n=1 Tax=Limnohabitans sp. INBF002 TaxID=2986280 RepID=UPI002491A4BB|nr:hypothetical protein [Limnohabitans sp. INBF002]